MSVVRRYSLTSAVDVGAMQKCIAPGALEGPLVPSPGQMVDVPLDEEVAGYAETVDEYMGMLGYVFVSEDPAKSLKEAAMAVTPLVEVNGLRLTPQTGVAVPVGNSAGITNIYLTPYKSNAIALYSGTAWTVRTTAEITLAITGRTALLPVDIFASWDGTAVVLEVLDWTNATTRATTLTRVDGVWTKTGDSTRRYVGTFLPRSATTADWITNLDLNGAGTPLRMDIWNVDNQVPIGFTMVDSGAPFAWTANAIRQWRADADAQLEVVVGIQGAYTQVEAVTSAQTSFIGQAINLPMGVDALTADPECLFSSVASNEVHAVYSSLAVSVPIGFHFVSWLQKGKTASGTAIWQGGTNNLAGMNGVHPC